MTLIWYVLPSVFKSLMLKFDWFYMKFDWFVGLSYLHNKCMSSFMNVYLVLWLGFQVWTDELFKLATNILSQNASRNVFLLKAWVLCVCACVCVCVRMCVRMRVRLTLKRLFEAKWHVSVAQIQKIQSVRPLHKFLYCSVACDSFF